MYTYWILADWLTRSSAILVNPEKVRNDIHIIPYVLLYGGYFMLSRCFPEGLIKTPLKYHKIEGFYFYSNEAIKLEHLVN